MRLYLTGSHLSYKSREHIFSSGSGGTRMLQQGMVSDQANNILHYLQQVALVRSVAANEVQHGQDNSLGFSKYFCPDHARILAKTALNVLADQFGEEAARCSGFDPLRRWIMSGEAAYFDDLPPKATETPSVLSGTDVHWCILTSHKDKLMAAVGFYGGPGWMFRMGKLPEECRDLREYPYGLVCDWKNRQDLELFDFIGRFREAAI